MMQKILLDLKTRLLNTMVEEDLMLAKHRCPRILTMENLWHSEHSRDPPIGVRLFYKMVQNDARERPIYTNFPLTFNCNDVIDHCLKIVSSWPYEEISRNFIEYLNKVSVFIML